MDLPDDSLGLGPPDRSDFDWLVPEADDGAESRLPRAASLPNPNPACAQARTLDFCTPGPTHAILLGEHWIGQAECHTP